MLFIYSSSSPFPLPPVLEAVVSCPRYSLKDAYSTKLAKAEFTLKQLLLPLFKTFPFVANTIFTLYESSPNQYLKEIGDRSVSVVQEINSKDLNLGVAAWMDGRVESRDTWEVGSLTPISRVLTCETRSEEQQFGVESKFILDAMNLIPVYLKRYVMWAVE